jgi:hypothetical protein
MEQETVYIFGSNSGGFHGAGTAGYAMRGTYKNNWRSDQEFLEAIQSTPGSPKRIGKLAVFGVARGLQQGREGKSYAIQTVRRPGERRSVSLEEIEYQLVQLWNFAKEHPEYLFQMNPLGCGYAGYTHQEMWKLVNAIIKDHGLPSNIQNALEAFEDRTVADTLTHED